MKFRWWYVSMGVTAVLVLVSMMYFGAFLCVPVEDLSCVSLMGAQREIPATPPTAIVPVTPPTPSNTPSNSSSLIPVGTGETVPPNGNKINFTLSFQISSDFTKYGFDAPIGSLGANPDMKVHSGDTVTIHLTNPSKSFHAFGIVIDANNPIAVIWDSAFKTPDSPMKPGESGDVTFVAGTPGLYHYLCTVPGHAALGMDGNFIVEP